MNKIWDSNLNDDLKIKFFQSTVESVLLYGTETWMMNKKMRDRLDGTFTKMLRSVLGLSWKDHKTNKELYGNLSKVSTVLQERRLRFV
eukprot:gene2384-18027_t